MLKHNKCICCLCTFINIALSVILLFFVEVTDKSFFRLLYTIYIPLVRIKLCVVLIERRKNTKKTCRLELITQKIFYKKCRPFLYYFFGFEETGDIGTDKKTSNVRRICIYKINDRLQHWPKERRRLRRRSRSRKRKEERIEDSKKNALVMTRGRRTGRFLQEAFLKSIREVAERKR